MDLGLKNKRALVTGGSRGIGKAIARQLALVAFLASPRSLALNGEAISGGGGSPGTIHY